MRVACCWDDGSYNDIRLVELFRKYGVKATFNLCPGGRGEEDSPNRWANPGENGGFMGYFPGMAGLKRYKELYQGFQVASHCWRHEVVGRVSLDEFVEAAMKARNYLEELFQRPCTGFAWPNGVFSDEAAAALAAEGFEYGRTTQYTDDVAASACNNALQLKSNCHFLNCGTFYNCYRQAKENGRDFYFWGHSFEMMDCEQLWQQLEMKLQFIAQDPDAEWVDVIDLVRAAKGENK